MRFTAWGVRPTWPMTGISAETMRSMVSAIRVPPSSFTAAAPDSLTKRMALRSASSGLTW